MFFLDPSGNALEFRAFRDLDQLFAVCMPSEIGISLLQRAPPKTVSFSAISCSR
jgi:hypothetical protein